MIDVRTAPFGILLLRLTAGLALLAHSFYLKIFVFSMAGTAGFFESLGLPGFLAWLTLFVEIITGLMLVFSVKPRLAALIAVPGMMGAVWAHSGNGWLFSNADGGWEYPLFWALVLLSIALLGDGSATTVRTSKPSR